MTTKLLGSVFVAAHACVIHPLVWAMNDAPWTWRLHDLVCDAAVYFGAAIPMGADHSIMRGTRYVPPVVDGDIVYRGGLRGIRHD